MENWNKEFPTIAITVSDKDGKILDMNDRSIATFANSGGADLIGKNLSGCHPPRAQEIIKSLIETQRVNAYTIEKEGLKKMIYQTPWYENGEFGGLVEFSIVLPEDMPHYVRQAKKD